MPLNGKVAIVTGGNSGIGRAIVLGLAKAYRHRLESEISTLGDAAIGVEAAVSRIAELQALFDATVAKFGRVDTW